MSKVYNGNMQDYNALIERGYDFKLGDYVRRGWEIFSKDPAQFVGFTLLTFLVFAVVGFIPIVGNLVGVILTPLVSAGYYIVADRYAKGQSVTFNDFFRGTEDLAQLVVGNLLTSLLTALGMVLLVIPGVYLAVAYGFVVPFIIFGRLEFWPAMETSRKVITKQWGQFFLLALVGVGIFLLGALALGIGIIVAVPVVACIYYAAFEDIIMRQTSTMDDIIDEIGDQEGSNQADPYTGDF